MLKELVAGILLGTSVLFGQGKSDERKELVQVVDSVTGEALPGANIFFGNSQGTATDINGYATLSSDKDTVYNLKISYVGYSPLEKAVDIDNIPSTTKIALSPLILESSEVVVSGDRSKTLDAVLNNTENISHESITNTHLLTGSATEQVFAQMTGTTTTPGKEFYYSATGDEVVLKYHEMPMKLADFFNISGVLNSNNTDVIVTSFAPSPENEGMQVNIDARMRKPAQGINIVALLNHLRGNIGAEGNIDSLLGDRVWFGVNYEGNISGVYLKSKDISPRNNKYTSVVSTEWGPSSITLAGIHKNTSIILSKNDKSPSLQDIQTGLSAEYKTTNDASLELVYVFNDNARKFRLENLIDSRQDEIMHELRGMLSADDGPGFLTLGVDMKYLIYSQNMLLDGEDDPEIQSLKEKINPTNYFSIMPINLFVTQEIALGEKTAVIGGLGLLFDAKVAKKVARGPYAKLRTELLGLDAFLTGRLSYSHIGLKPYSDDIDFKEYTTSDYPKSFQTKLELRKNLFGGVLSGGALYYDFFDHPNSNISVNPLQEYFINHANDLDKDSLRAIILISNPELLTDPDAMQRLDSLLLSLQTTKQDINDELGIYEQRFYNNPNRYGGAVFLEYRADNMFLSATLSKTFERGTGTPYNNDIEFILKGHIYFNLNEYFDFDISKYFTISAYAEYSTGRPYTGLTLMPSIAEERGIQGQLEEYKEQLPKGYYELLSEKREVPKDRNEERYPASITSSISVTWHAINLPGGIKGYVSAYVNNPHTLFNLVEKNTYQIYYTTESGQFVQKKSQDLGCIPGFDVMFSIPIAK